MTTVFISGSISIHKLPECVESSIQKIRDQNIGILVGDAAGIDTMVQKYCKSLDYYAVSVYSIYSSPRYRINGFSSKYVIVKSDTKRERDRQQEKDEAMTMNSDYSLVVWDGKSKGSYNNILRAIENDKKTKVYLSYENAYLEKTRINKDDIEYIYRKNNGYSAAEVVQYLKNEDEDYFQNTRSFNKCLLDINVIKKEDGIYKPMDKYEHLFIINKYRGKVKGVKFNNDFINWVKQWIEEIKPPEELSMF